MAQKNDIFRFSLQSGDVIHYAYSSKLNSGQQYVSGGSVMTKEMMMEQNFMLSLNATKSSDKYSIPLDVSVSDFNTTITQEAGKEKLVTEVQRSKVVQTKTKANGKEEITIDTENEIGMNYAKVNLEQFSGYHKKGQIVINEKGYQKGTNGNIDFQMIWAPNMERCAFFGIVFPEGPVKVGDSWTITDSLGYVAGGQLQTPYPMNYTFTRTADIEKDGKTLVVFEFTNAVSVSGVKSIREDGHVTYSIFERNISGKILFDKKAEIVNRLEIYENGGSRADVKGKNNAFGLNENMEAMYVYQLAE